MAKRDLILHNLWWKILSLLLAALMYFTIETAFQRDENLRETPVVTESSRSFPALSITIMTAANNSNQFRLDPVSVEVELSGKAVDLERLQPRQIDAYVDLSDAGNEISMRKEIQVQIPSQFRIKSIKPLYVSVERIPAHADTP